MIWNKKNILLFIIMIVIFGGFLIKLVGYYIDLKTYEQLAFRNTIFKDVQYAERGIILDRKGKKVVDNLLSYNLMVVPSQINEQTDTNLLCKILLISKSDFTFRLKELIQKNNPYRESNFRQHLSIKERCAIEENLQFLNGFFLKKTPFRNYLYPYGFHAFGYVSEVTENEIEASDGKYLLNSEVGRNGVEKSYDHLLRGKDGEKLWLRNSSNQIVQPFDDEKKDIQPVRGASLISTIDIELQMLAEKLMKNKKGAIIAIEPSSGEVLCLVSAPEVNPLLMRKDVRTDYFNSLVVHPAAPLLNRVTQGRYSPGSVFKIVEALIAVNNNFIDPSFGYPCNGVYLECKKPLRCEHHNPGHANSLHAAIVNSCNSYFVNLFSKIWVNLKNAKGKEHPLNAFKNELKNLGFGRTIGTDIFGEKKGFLPDSSFFTKLYGGNSWNFCTIMSLGIGQGELLFTPLQIANFMAIVANHGHYVTPHLVKAKIINNDTALLKFDKKQIEGVQPEAYPIIIDAMRDVVQYGTAAGSKVKGLPICGKTGTVEKFGYKNGVRYKKLNNAVFAGFAPAKNPKICFAVIIEDAGYGSVTAAPIASLIAEKYIRDTISSERVQWVDYLSNLKFKELVP